MSDIRPARVRMAGVVGVPKGERPVVAVGDLEAGNAGRYRVKWYAK